MYIYICLYTCIHTRRYIKIFHSGFVGNWFDPWVEKTPWRREWLPTPVFRPGGFHRQRSPRGHKESDKTERLSLSLSKIGNKC